MKNVKQQSKTQFDLKKDNFISFPEIRRPGKEDDFKKSGSNSNYYKIVEKLSSDDSHFGLSYLADKYQAGVKKGKVFIKTPRISTGLPTSEIQRHLGLIFQSFTAEHLHKDVIKRLNKKKKVAAVTYDIGFYRVSNKSHDNIIVPYLVQEFIGQDSLEKYFGKDEDNCEHGKFTGIKDPAKWFELAESLIQIVRRVHNNQIIHGEIEPKNFLVKPDKNNVLQPILVDFGKSFLLDVSLAHSETTRSGNAFVAPECRHQRDAYSATADIYSLGGVLFYLSTGSKPPDIEEWGKSAISPSKKWNEFNNEDVENWKNHIHDKFKENKGLMKKHEGIVKIIDKCLRPLPEDRYASADKLLQALDSVRYEQSSREKDPQGLLKSMVSNDLPDMKNWDPLFKTITCGKIELLKKEIADMANNHFEIYGEREDLIDSLVKYISVLTVGDFYVTVTVPEYWTKDNLGVNGRFLTVNKDLVRAGVHIRRLFLVSEEDLAEKTESLKILQAHFQAYKDLGKLGISQPIFKFENQSGKTFESSNSQSEGTMYVGLLRFPTREELKEYQRTTSHVAIWKRKDASKTMSIIFSSRPKFDQGKVKGSQIVKVRFRQQEIGTEYETMVGMFENPTIESLAAIFESDSKNP